MREVDVRELSPPLIFVGYLEERMNGIQEVRGSIPLVSTIKNLRALGII